MRQEAKEPRSEPPMVPAKAPRDRSPALAWLFLVGLLPSRARLRFTRQEIIRRGLTKDDIEGLRKCWGLRVPGLRPGLSSHAP